MFIFNYQIYPVFKFSSYYLKGCLYSVLSFVLVPQLFCLSLTLHTTLFYNTLLFLVLSIRCTVLRTPVSCLMDLSVKLLERVSVVLPHYSTSLQVVEYDLQDLPFRF